MSFDCVSLYTSVDLNLVINKIISSIYENVDNFFPKSSKTVIINKLKIIKETAPPSEFLLREFFNAICTKYNSFQTLNGFYRQIQGCSMGSKLSPSLANIFCDLFETEIIDPEIENGTLKCYFRYVDDMVCIIRKNHKDILLEKLNKFNPNLKFTMNSMENNELIYLDTKIINCNGNLNLEMYRKPQSSENLLNFRNGVSPKGYKISTLVGELYRCNNTTSTPEALNKALNDTKNIFLKNQYPLKLINQKISELKIKKFPPSQSKARRDEELKNTQNTNFTVSLPFTSFRCSIIASKIKRILSQYTPYYKLNVVFSTINLTHIISPRLKPEKSYYLNNDLIYDYLCPCEATYIGETQQLLHERILQHRRNKDGVLHLHIKTCPKYIEKFQIKYSVEPDHAPKSIQRKFFESHFSVVVKNLHFQSFRKTFEGLLITLKKPSLNIQVPHKCLTFLCVCIIPDNSIT